MHQALIDCAECMKVSRGIFFIVHCHPTVSLCIISLYIVFVLIFFAVILSLYRHNWHSALLAYALCDWSCEMVVLKCVGCYNPMANVIVSALVYLLSVGDVSFCGKKRMKYPPSPLRQQQTPCITSKSVHNPVSWSTQPNQGQHASHSPNLLRVRVAMTVLHT